MLDGFSSHVWKRLGIDRPPGLRNDMLMALTAREIVATVVTRNLQEFLRIATKVPGLRVAAP